MELSSRTLVTIMTEALLEDRIIRDLRRIGAHGWTVTDARGSGAHGARSSDWEQSANIRIEVVCEQSRAEEIMRHLQETYYQHFAMIAFVSRVDVLRPEKF